MNSRLLLIPAILATTATFGASADVLLAPLDTRAQAAALLSGGHIGHGTETAVNVTRSAVESDEHAQAAALLSGSRTTAKNSQSSETGKALGQHPAVLVAQKWSTRGIDPNTFIVAHPARLQLHAAADPDKDRVIREDAQDAENAARGAAARR